MLVEESIWIGSIQYIDESINVMLTLIDNESVLTGHIQIIDPENSKLHEMGNITIGSKVSDTVKFMTDTELEVNAELETDFLNGTILFPPRNEEDSFKADINLKEGTALYMPIVRR